MDEALEVVTTAPETGKWVMGALFIILGGFAAYWMNRKRRGPTGGATRDRDGPKPRRK